MTRLVAVVAGLGACRDDDFGLDAQLEPAPDARAAPAVRELVLDSEVPHRLELVLDDGQDVRTAVFDAWTRHRTVPVVGLRPGRTTTVVAHVEGEGGGRVTRDWQVRVPELPAAFPVRDALVVDADRVEPTWWLLDLGTPSDGQGWLVLLDELGQVVWWYDEPWAAGDLRAADGGLVFVLEGGVQRMDWLGRLGRRWGADPLPDAPLAAWVPTEVIELHHEAFPLDGGYWSLDRALRTVHGFPASYDGAQTETELVSESAVVRVSGDGEVDSRWPLGDVLDLHRIGWDSLGNTEIGGRDWVHANAVVAHPDDDGIVVNSRHQDCVFEVGPDGALRWILGTPTGWTSPWSESLLAPVGPITWPYHAHAPSFAPDGTLVLFDNHVWGHTPAEPAVDEGPSRVVRYRIDEDARTVEQIAEYVDTATGPLFSMALGSAQVLPETGNVAGLYGWVADEGGLTNQSRGWGELSVRLVQWSEGGEVVLDVRFRTDLAQDRDGVKTYRAFPVPTPWTGAGAAAGRWVR